MFGLGTWEIVAILLVVLIIFGAGKLPEIGGGMGKAIKNFKKAVVDTEKGDTYVKEEKTKADKIEEK
jgi:sec-independent protein translocase protein TatA